MKNKVLILFVLVLIVSLSSCSLEYQIAKKYQKELSNTIVILADKPELHKTNSKIIIAEYVSDAEYDSLYKQSMESSSFVGKIDIDTYWNQRKTEIENGIINSGFTYIPSDSINEFEAKEGPKFTFTIKQIEIEEHPVYFMSSYTSKKEIYGYFTENSLEDITAVDFSANISNYVGEEYYSRTVYNQVLVGAPTTNYRQGHYKQRRSCVVQQPDLILDGKGYYFMIYRENYIASKSIMESQIIIYKPINAITVHYWIEVNTYLADEGHKSELIYISRSIEDKVTNDEKLKYKHLQNIKSTAKFSDLGFEIDSINLYELEESSSLWSQEITNMLNSYALNKVIDYRMQNVSDVKKRKWYWELDIKSGRLIATDKEIIYNVLESSDN